MLTGVGLSSSIREYGSMGLGTCSKFPDETAKLCRRIPNYITDDRIFLAIIFDSELNLQIFPT